MSKSIKLSQKQWFALKLQIAKDYPRSVWLIRERMRDVLGFTDRDYKHYDIKNHRYIEEVHLDFFNEPKRTMFLLKYTKFLQKEPIVLDQI